MYWAAAVTPKAPRPTNGAAGAPTIEAAVSPPAIPPATTGATIWPIDPPASSLKASQFLPSPKPTWLYLDSPALTSAARASGVSSAAKRAAGAAMRPAWVVPSIREPKNPASFLGSSGVGAGLDCAYWFAHTQAVFESGASTS